MNISQILQKTDKKFKDAKIEFSLLDAEILLAFVLKKNREFLLTHPEYKLSKLPACLASESIAGRQITNYELLITKRLKGWPIAYLTGHKEFYGLNFMVNKNVLIPRPETELIIDEAIQISQNIKHLTFIDVGTGSGCIIISLIKTLKNQSKFEIKNSKFLAIDISKQALKIAKKNAEQNKVDKQIKFIQSNLLSNLNKSKISRQPHFAKNCGQVNPKSKIVILANLPYLTPEQIKKSPSIQKEPKLALSAGKDGLKYYKKLFKQIKELLKTQNNFDLDISAICEIDPSQSLAIKNLAKKKLPITNFTIKKDYNKKNRFAIFHINQPR